MWVVTVYYLTLRYPDVQSWLPLLFFPCLQFIDYLALQPLVIELHGRLSAEKSSTPSGLTTSELMKQRSSRANLALIANPGFKVGVSVCSHDLINNPCDPGRRMMRSIECHVSSTLSSGKLTG